MYISVIENVKNPFTVLLIFYNYNKSITAIDNHFDYLQNTDCYYSLVALSQLQNRVKIYIK